MVARIKGLELPGSWLRFKGSGFRVQGQRIQVYDSGFGVCGFRV